MTTKLSPYAPIYALIAIAISSSTEFTQLRNVCVVAFDELISAVAISFVLIRGGDAREWENWPISELEANGLHWRTILQFISLAAAVF